MSIQSITEHLKRWAGHPTLPPVVSAYMPAADGDMATLEELAERVFDAVDAAFANGEIVPTGSHYGTDDEQFYWEELRVCAFGMGFQYWPDDRAAEQLAVWRSQLDGVA
jgi:hypothetical protein